MRERLGYVPELDGLRGVAIAAVVLCHYFGLPGGFFGVDLFFVLSGFLITTLLLEDGRLGGFYARRARRLLPAVGVLLVFLLPLVRWQEAAEGGLYFANGFRAFAHHDPLKATPFDHLWSLAEEEQFYLIWPLGLALLGQRHHRRLACALAAAFVLLVCYRAGLAANGASFRRLYFAPDTHADGLVIGCLAAVVRPRLPRWADFVALGVIVGMFAFASSPSIGWQVAGLPALEIAAAVVVLAAAHGELAFLELRPLVWLGLISYSLYLWHQPVRFMFGLHHPLIALPIALLLAVCSYRYVELPFRRRHAAQSDERGIKALGTAADAAA